MRFEAKIVFGPKQVGELDSLFYAIPIFGEKMLRLFGWYFSAHDHFS